MESYQVVATGTDRHCKDPGEATWVASGRHNYDTATVMAAVYNAVDPYWTYSVQPA